MRNNHHINRHKARTGINAGAVPLACTVEHRKTMRDGLRILARIIARAHLERQMKERSAAAPCRPPKGESLD